MWLPRPIRDRIGPFLFLEEERWIEPRQDQPGGYWMAYPPLERTKIKVQHVYVQTDRGWRRVP